MATTIIGILLIVMSVFLVIAVLMQSSKDHRLGASIAGGAETFFGKQKGKSMDAMFNKLTTVIAIVFVVLVLVLYFIAPSSAPVESDVNASGADLTEVSEDSSDANLAEVENAETENADIVEDVADNTAEEVVDTAEDTAENTADEQ